MGCGGGLWYKKAHDEWKMQLVAQCLGTLPLAPLSRHAQKAPNPVKLAVKINHHISNVACSFLSSHLFKMKSLMVSHHLQCLIYLMAASPWGNERKIPFPVQNTNVCMSPITSPTRAKAHIHTHTCVQAHSILTRRVFFLSRHKKSTELRTNMS